MASKSKAEEASKPSFSLSRRPKIATAVKPQAKSRSKRKKRSLSSSLLPIPSFRNTNDDELARLEKEFFNDDESRSRNKRTKQQPSPSAKTPLPAFDVDSSDDDDDDLLSTKPIFAKKAASSKQVEEKSKSPVATSSPDSPLEQDFVFDSPPKAKTTESTTEGDDEKTPEDNNETDSSSLVQAIDRHVRASDPQKVTIKDIVAAVENELSFTLNDDQHALVKTRVLQLLSPPKQPSQTVLEEAVDRIFATSNLETCTTNQIVATLQQDFRQVFTKETKKIIKRRLAHLLKQHTQNQKANEAVAVDQLPAAPDTDQSPNKATNRVSQKAPAKSNNAKAQESEIECVEILEHPVNPSKKAAPKKSAKASSTSLSLDNTPEKPRRRWRGKAPTAKESKPARQEVAAEKSAASKPCGRKRTRGSCQLCLNCPCTMKHETGESPATLEFSQSDAAVEKTLIKRLQKLEKTTERYAVQEDAVRRKLKKHRRDMWKEREVSIAQENVGLAGGSRFLPDVDELEQRLESRIETTKVSSATVAKAQSNMFDFARTFQPTLTQMFDGNKKDEANTDEGLLENKQAAPVETIDEEQVIDLSIAQEDVRGEEQEIIVVAEEQQDASMSSNEESEYDGSHSSEAMGQVHRLNWSQGMKDGEPETQVDTTNSLWGSLIAGRFDCTWDRLFDDPAETENLGMDALLNMFGPTQATDGITDEELLSSQTGEVGMSMLSQRGQQLAEDVLCRIEGDQDKVAALDSACPKWRENIIFAMHQREAMDVREALDSVRETKAKLQRAKDEMLKAIRRQEMVLETFEDALDQSLSRLEGSKDENLNEGFIASASPSRRGSVECEIKTIVPSTSASLCGHESAPDSPMSQGSLVASQ